MNSLYATYEDISDCWPIFKHNIEGFFPLRNVHKTKTLVSLDVNTIIRNIPLINLKFVPLKAELLAHKSLLNLNERPYLHIFIGFCEDIDVYRQHFRPKLKSWLEAVSIRKTHQYIVILIEDQSIVHDNSKNNKTFLLDKIRFDFSDKASLKLISMKLLPGEVLSTIPECINLISESVYHSTIMNLNQIDEDIRKLAAQQNDPDWNFFTFFLTKESKALALCDLGLTSEALACYDELEALFLDLNASENDCTSKFESILPVDSSISGFDLSPTNWIKFRELIHKNRISLYEFRVYLLSRQIHILKESKDKANILLRCKEFVCQSIFIEKFDQKDKSEWIFGVIFFVLKIIDFESIQTENRQELSNLLAEVLILAEGQITFDAGNISGENYIDNLSDLPQLINLPYPLEIDKMAHFKISALRYCCKILKNSSFTHKQLMISLKLSDLYSKMDLFNIALEVLQETSEQLLVKNWPLVRIVLIEKVCNCYWNLNMRREYLRKYFEIISIKESHQLVDESEFYKINEAVFLLDDSLAFNFDDFFLIKHLSTDSSQDFVSLDITIFSKFKMPFKEYQIELILSGETDDVIFNSTTVPIIIEGNIITSKLSCKNDYSEGIHKIKSISIKIAKVEFKSEKGSDIWKKDVDLLATSFIHVEAIVPKNFNFSNPYIILSCQNYGVFDVENLTLEVAPSDLEINLSHETDQQFIESSGSTFVSISKLASKSSFEVQCNINKYSNGCQIIRVFTSHNRNESKLKTSHVIKVVLPNPWTINRFDFNYENIDIYCLEISPYFYPFKNIKILKICTDASNQVSDFNFEFDKHCSNLNFYAQSVDESNNLNITFLQNEVENSITIPIDESKLDIIYCKCIPMIDTLDIRLGIPITFKVTVTGCENSREIPYSVNFDHSHWVLSGASSGYIKSNWSFEIVPISLGLLQLPTIVLLKPLPIRLIAAGSTIFVTV